MLRLSRTVTCLALIGALGVLVSNTRTSTTTKPTSEPLWSWEFDVGTTLAIPATELLPDDSKPAPTVALLSSPPALLSSQGPVLTWSAAPSATHYWLAINPNYDTWTNGAGYWPAFWMVGPSARLQTIGEIDIAESVGQFAGIHAHFTYRGDSPTACSCSAPTPSSSHSHIALIWTDLGHPVVARFTEGMQVTAEAADEIKSGKILLEVPAEMRVAEPRIVRANIATDNSAQLQRSFLLPPPREISGVMLTALTRARIDDDDGNFTVRAMTVDQQSLPPQGFAQFIFSVTPNHSGLLPLRLIVAQKFTHTSAEAQREQVVSTVGVTVHPNRPHQLLHFITQNWALLTGLITGAISIWGFLTNKRQETRRPPRAVGFRAAMTA